MNKKNKVHPIEFGMKDEIDVMVQDIESELEKFNEASENEIRNMYRQHDNENHYHNNTAKIMDPIAKRFIEDSPRSTQKEENIFSHQIVNVDENVVADNLKEKFLTLTSQIKEYKHRYQVANEKLKEAESKISEIVVKVDSLEEENRLLKVQSRELKPGSVAAARTVAGQAQFNNDLNKRSEQLRKALLSDENEDDIAISVNDLITSKDVLGSIKSWLLQYIPLKRDLRQIQARFGSSVSSYFIFCRFIFIQFSCVAALMIIFLIFHIYSMVDRGVHTWNNFVSGQGYLPELMKFSSFGTNERLAHSFVVIIMLVATFIFLSVQLVSEHKLALTISAIDAGNEAPHSREVLCAWDFGVKSKVDIDELCNKLGNIYLQQLEESRTQGIKKSRSNYETFIIYLRRITGFLLYLCVLVASFAAIIYITINSSSISKQSSSINGLSNVGSLIAPFSLSTINNVVPTLIQYITEIECWDSAQTELTFQLLRVYLSNTLNSLILAFSYLLLSDPYLLAQYPYFRNSLELKLNSDYNCRMDQAADGLFTLVAFSWALSLVTFTASPYIFRIIGIIMKQPYEKTEFNVAQSMVTKLSFMGLVYISFPFAPLTMLFIPIYLFIGFKWEKYAIKHLYTKPKRPFRGQSASVVFSFFYLATFALVGLTVGSYIITTDGLPKNCSIQDEHYHLCADAVGSSYDATSSGGSSVYEYVCTTDSSNIYYDYWGKGTTLSTLYPAVICNYACGPFVNERSIAAPFKEVIFSSTVFAVLWEAIFDYPYVPWFCAIVLAVTIAMRANAHEVAKYASFQKERALEAQIAGSEAERKRQEKIISKLKSIEDKELDEEDETEGITAMNGNKTVSAADEVVSF